MTFPTNIRASDIPRKSADRQQNLRALIIEDDAGLDDLLNLRSDGKCIAFVLALAVHHHPAFGRVGIIDVYLQRTDRELLANPDGHFNQTRDDSRGPEQKSTLLYYHH